MELGPTEKSIIEWYKQNWNGQTLLSRTPWPVSLDTSLSTGDHAWLVETGEEIMNDYFHRFGISHSGFDLLEYWPVEPGWIPNILLPKSMRNEYKAPKKLTLRMLAESAKVGRWLYD
ncbi:DUF1493 family protein [Pantoea sp.]|uniref:DUF1493 family protein n=1 Tax=Pantoea sp. TaxID=69393 RepID=UPI0031D9D7A3